MSPESVLSWCQSYISHLLAIPISNVAADCDIEDLGFDSAASVSMVLALEEKVGKELDPAILFEHRTLRALAMAVGD